MNKIIRTKLLTILMSCSIVGANSQVIEYTSKDSVDGKPKFEGSLTGRLKLNGVYDIKGNLNGKSAFLIHENNIDGKSTPGLWVDMRQSRLCFDGIQRLNNGKEIFTRIEGDFESSPNNQSIFRLLQAYLKYDKILVGKTWTTFGDINIYPSSLDWDGPTGMVNGRRIMVRYTIDYNSVLESDIAAEVMEPRRPFDYTVPETNNSINYEPRRLPDLVGTLNYKLNPGFMKLAAIYRHIDYGYLNKHKVANGYGISAMLNIQPSSFKKDIFNLQLNYGKGIAEYILPIQGSRLDGNVSRDDLSKLNLLPVMGGFASYQYYWNKKAHSLFIVSFVDFDSKKADFEWQKMQNIYTGVNFMYDILPNLSTGGELLWGRKILKYEKETKHADALRFNFGLVYNF